MTGSNSSGVGINRVVISLLFLFFISGFSALCYQLVWQRMLFATFGINIESVTIIISLFMFGLGIGALTGAKLQKYPQHLLNLFICCELLIALFGIMSLSLIAWLGSLQYLDSLWPIALCVYALFAVPTLLMGATLPILVGYIDRFVGHTGKTTGWLYASNTFGAAIAAWAVVKLFFVWWGLNTTIEIAASLNVLTAGLGFLLYKRHSANVKNYIEKGSPSIPTDTSLGQPPQTLLLTIGFALGYISLSQELIWYRVLGFITANKPQILGQLLAAFLAGIALASITASKICSTKKNTYAYIFYTLLLMLFIWYISFPILAYVTGHYGQPTGITTALLLTGITAFFSGGIFPVLCHILQSQTQLTSGRAVGKLYFVNVMGAAAGPLITGFAIFEYFSIQTAVLCIGLIIAVVMLLLASNFHTRRQPDYKRIGMTSVVLLLGYGLYLEAYGGFLEKLQFARPYPAPYAWLNTNHSGIISVAGNTVYGNGAYDGKMNIYPKRNINGIDRAYAIPTFHPNPKKILQIGLSSGSWAKAISMYQPLEELVVVEINKGYLEIISHYPDHADILQNPKIKLTINDGRRWLRNHQEEKFDVIVMNTIYYWRSNATNLLSMEFMELCKKHLNTGGYVYINTTGAREVAYTAAHVFNYVAYAPGNMIIAGDIASDVDIQTRISNLKNFIYPNGQIVFQKENLVADIINRQYPNVRDTILQKENTLLITDDNMATEFKK